MVASAIFTNYTCVFLFFFSFFPFSFPVSSIYVHEKQLRYIIVFSRGHFFFTYNDAQKRLHLHVRIAEGYIYFNYELTESKQLTGEPPIARYFPQVQRP